MIHLLCFTDNKQWCRKLVKLIHQSRGGGRINMETASLNIAYVDWQHPSNSANGFMANSHRRERRRWR